MTMSEKPPGPSDTDPRRAETQSTSTTPAEPAVNVFHSTADRDPQIVRQQAATGLSPDDAAESGPAIIPQDATQPNKLSILEKLRKWDPAVELPNKGAVARDHLANEVSLTVAPLFCACMSGSTDVVRCREHFWPGFGVLLGCNAQAPESLELTVISFIVRGKQHILVPCLRRRRRHSTLPPPSSCLQ